MDMRYKWLNKQDNDRIILFFNGWGMDSEIVNHLACKDYDVVMFYDYNSLETDFNFDCLTKYSQKNLIAWSMGVMVGSIFAPQIKYINKSVAINGTLFPIHSEYGIPPRIYELTIRGFNAQGRVKFINNMFDSPVTVALNRDLENQQQELCALKNYTPNIEFKYNKVLISNNDKIIPTKNQCQFWGIEPNIQSGHCPFFKFHSWSELL